MLVTGCGGGDSDPVPTPTPKPTPTPTPTLDQQRAQAATQTAQNNASCIAVQPFYWEVGNSSVVLAGATAGGATPTAITPMLIASASKWIFGSYVVELRNGSPLSANDLSALRMQSGHTNLKYGVCKTSLTVDSCFNANNGAGTNADVDNNAIGKFFYNGGHFQWLADTDLVLATKSSSTLQAAVAAQLGTDFTFTYDSPQLAGGVQTTGQDYGFFLRKILSNQLRMHDMLGTNAVCTNPATCPQALYAPIGSSESWHYSLGHWVEDDPTVGDGAFSSPGAFGFYPWIDASKTYYGVLARYSLPVQIGDTVATDSVLCGRKIRKAWMTATAQ
jgi:hypothetical protein